MMAEGRDVVVADDVASRVAGGRWSNRIRDGRPGRWTGYIGRGGVVFALIVDRDPEDVAAWVAGTANVIPDRRGAGAS